MQGPFTWHVLKYWLIKNNDDDIENVLCFNHHGSLNNINHLFVSRLNAFVSVGTRINLLPCLDGMSTVLFIILQTCAYICILKFRCNCIHFKNWHFIPLILDLRFALTKTYRARIKDENARL